ncbi:MAG: hypothetical protein J6T13_01360 [Bacteroidales bacterium]|nr:hypothetical protein [Bacteroidales bacterium]
MKNNIIIHFFVLALLASGFLTGCHRPEPEPDVSITELNITEWSVPNLNTNLQENILYRIDSLRQLQDLFIYGIPLSDVDYLSDIDFNEHTLLFFLTSWNNHGLNVSWEKVDDNNYNLHAELWETAAAEVGHQIFYVCMTNRKLKNTEHVSFSITQHDIPYEE